MAEHRQLLVAANLIQELEVEATIVEPSDLDCNEESAIKVQAEVVGAAGAAPGSAKAAVEGATGPAGRVIIGQKRRQKAQAGNAMTGDEARAQAEREGLAFVKSTANATGYYGVTHDARGKNFPYAAYVFDGGKESNWRGRFIGSYATAEEAALAYARATSNTVERTINPKEVLGPKEVHTRTLQCKRCGLLVDWTCAKAFASKRKRKELHVGDGCNGIRCGDRKATRLQSARSQMKFAEQLLRGERKLLEWPKNVDDKKTIPRPVEIARELATQLLARHGKPEKC